MYSPDERRVNGAAQLKRQLSSRPSGATNQSINVKFFVRLFSARPIRRGVGATNDAATKACRTRRLSRLRQFAEVKSENSIIFTVIYESTDQRYGNTVMQAFNSNITGHA